MPTLNQYAAVLAFVTESTDGVTWDEITDAVGQHFREDEDQTFPIFTLSCLGLLAPVSYYDVPGRAVRAERVLASPDALDRLRKLNTARCIVEKHRDEWCDDPATLDAELILNTGLRLREATFQLEVLGVLPSREES